MSDMLLKQVLTLTKEGWKNTGRLDDQLRPYFNRREEQTTRGNCLMWGIRAVIPGNAATYLEEITSNPSRDSENEIISSFARVVARNQ